jgi:putative intracellular protease/amidase
MKLKYKKIGILMGAIDTAQDVVVDGELVTGRTDDVANLFASKLVEIPAAR